MAGERAQEQDKRIHEAEQALAAKAEACDDAQQRLHASQQHAQELDAHIDNLKLQIEVAACSWHLHHG